MGGGSGEGNPVQEISINLFGLNLRNVLSLSLSLFCRKRQAFSKVCFIATGGGQVPAGMCTKCRLVPFTYSQRLGELLHGSPWASARETFEFNFTGHLFNYFLISRNVNYIFPFFFLFPPSFFCAKMAPRSEYSKRKRKERKKEKNFNSSVKI